MTMEQRWFVLAPSYEFGERLDDFAHSHPEADQAGVADHLDQKTSVVSPGSDPRERCAVLRVVGDTDNLEPAALCLYRGWLLAGSEEARDFPIYCQRLSFFPEVPEHEAIAELFLPLK